MHLNRKIFRDSIKSYLYYKVTLGKLHSVCVDSYDYMVIQHSTNILFYSAYTYIPNIIAHTPPPKKHKHKIQRDNRSEKERDTRG